MTDNTGDLQYWLDNSQNVVVPPGDYYINALTGLKVKSGTNLTINGNLRALPTDQDWSRILLLEGVENVNIILNGKIVGERASHIGLDGTGHGMGLMISNSQHIAVSGPGSIQACWGDGIYVIGASDVRISGISSIGNRRQGMSVISVDGMAVNNATFGYTQGTSPSAGIDLEPDYASEFIKNVDISHCYFVGNAGAGVLFGFGGAPQSNFVNVHVHDNVYKDCKPISGFDPWYAKLGYATLRWWPGIPGVIESYDFWGYPESVSL